jgi:hypothetical protein
MPLMAKTGVTAKLPESARRKAKSLRANEALSDKRRREDDLHSHALASSATKHSHCMARITASVDDYKTRLAAYTASDDAATLDAIMAKFDDELDKRDAARREAANLNPAFSPKSSALENSSGGIIPLPPTYRPNLCGCHYFHNGGESSVVGA